MGTNRNRRLPADALIADRQVLVGIQLLTDYAPYNGAYSAEKLAELRQAMEAAQQAELSAQQALTAARDAALAAEWAVHDGVIGARTQVIAQYGPDSNAMQLVGLKRTSERRRPTRRAMPAT